MEGTLVDSNGTLIGYLSESAPVIFQPKKFDAIENLGTTNFSMQEQPFCIKNESEFPIFNVYIRPVNGTKFISTTLFPGWNPEQVAEIQANTSLASANLKWGRY